jgi:Xaa-Pro aminopeptidase
MKIDINGADAYLLSSESVHNADMYYATRFLAHDPFIYLNTGSEILLISDMELGRAKKESRIKDVIPTSQYGIMEKIRTFRDVENAYCEMIFEFLRSLNVNRITVPYNFPVQTADCLRKAGFDVTPIKSPFREMREVKNEKEIAAIQKAQRAGEMALEEGIMAIENAAIKNGVLWQDNSPLTTDSVRVIIERVLLSYGCEAPDIIIACGKGSSDPHWQGEGDLLPDEPIVIDMVPRSKKERYYSDMTRTVLRGIPGDELKEMYDAVLESQIAAIKRIKAGVSGSDIHNIVCDVLEEKGFKTARGKSGVFTEGFIHSTGHGVGLDIHEGPSISESGKELKTGNVITVEPGLYYKDTGGVRLEDVVIVTKTGCKNITMFEKKLVLK